MLIDVISEQLIQVTVEHYVSFSVLFLGHWLCVLWIDIRVFVTHGWYFL